MSDNPILSDIRNLSIQDRATSTDTHGNIFLVSLLANGGGTISPWWSAQRDKQLREFWKQSDHLSGALYTMISKMTAIPNKVVARNTSLRAHVNQAERLTDMIGMLTELGDGWVLFFSRFVEDLLTQDNGAFAEIIGEGDPSGPIIGQPLSVAHLDSRLCQRTGSMQFPVVYQDITGKLYKLHRSRVMYTSQMTSPIRDMYGVGYCAVSRAINTAQSLIDVMVYKQEKMGSRPHRQILITKGGLDPEDLQDAFQVAEHRMDSLGLTRYAKVIVGGSASLPESSVEEVDLASLPEGFDEEKAIIYGMATIALALGLDARELFPAMTAGATRADALLSHLKQRGKGPGQIIQSVEQLMNFKFLPPHLKFLFDLQDDAEDRQVAEIRQIRANRRVQDLSTGSMTNQTIRQQMYEEGDINRFQFERMELDDGRLPDGTPLMAMFYSNDAKIRKYLDLGVADPLNVEKNDQIKMLNAISERRAEVYKVLANGSNRTEREVAELASIALDTLEDKYRNPEITMKLDEIEPKPNEVDPRLRTVDLTQPKADEVNRAEEEDVSRQSTDDKPE